MRKQIENDEHVVYKILSTMEKVVYVGMTCDVDRRIREHRQAHWFSSDMTVAMEFFDDRESAHEREAHLIDFYKPENNKQHKEANVQVFKTPLILEKEEVVSGLKTENEAINYCVDQSMLKRRYLTNSALAASMEVSRAVLSKMKTGVVGIPAGKFVLFTEAVGSLALLQYYAMRVGLVLKTREDEREQQREIQRFKEQNAQLQERYQRVIGE